MDLEDDELSKVFDRPEISQKSREMTKNQMVIWNRWNHELSLRKKRMIDLKQSVEQQKLRREAETIAKTQPRNNQQNTAAQIKKETKRRTPAQFYANIAYWQEKKSQNLLRLQYKYIEEELKKLPFRPEINSFVSQNEVSSSNKVD